MGSWNTFARLAVVGLILGLVPLQAPPASCCPGALAGLAEGRSLDQSPATWTSAGGPIGFSAVYVLAADHSDPSRIFIGTSHGALKTSDGGGSWSVLPIGKGAGDRWMFLAMAVDPANPQVIYAAHYDGQLFKSTDGGSTWTNLWGSTWLARAVAVDSAGTVFLASTLGLQKSTTGGASWTELGHFGTIHAIAIDPTVRTTVYLGTSRGVYKSTDGGVVFSLANTGLTTTRVGSLAVSATSTSTLYAGTSNGVFTSTDAGDSWAAAGTETAGLEVAGLTVTASGAVFAAAEAQLFRSTNSGASWVPLTNGLPTPTAYLALTSTPTAVYVGYADGVAKTLDGGDSWQQLTTGLPYSEVQSLAFDPSNTSRLMAGTRKGVHVTDALPGAWVPGAPADLGYVWPIAFVPSVPNLAYAGGFCSGVWKSTDAGGTWTQHNTGLGVLCVEALAVDPIDPSTVYASTNHGIFKSIDAADSWTEISTQAMAWNGGLKDFQAFAVDPTARTTLYAVGGTPGGLFKSIDGGQTWSPMGLPLPADWWMYAYAVVIDPTSPSTVYIAAKGVYKSLDGGGTWAAAGLAGKTVRALVLVPGTPATLYAGVEQDNFVYRSQDGGASWVPFGAGSLPPVGVFSLVLSPSGETLYAGTAGFGVYSLPTSAPPCRLTCWADVPAVARLGVPVLFQGGLTTQECNGSVAYEWDFDADFEDGSPHAFVQSLSHTYGFAGGLTSHTWTMTVTGAGGVCSQSGTIQIEPYRARRRLHSGGP